MDSNLPLLTNALGRLPWYGQLTEEHRADMLEEFSDSLLALTSRDEFTQTAHSVFLIQALSHSAEHRTHILGTLGLGPADFDAQIDGWSWGEASGTLTPKPA
jgi:hypothetical protein